MGIFKSQKVILSKLDVIFEIAETLSNSLQLMIRHSKISRQYSRNIWALFMSNCEFVLDSDDERMSLISRVVKTIDNEADLIEFQAREGVTHYDRFTAVLPEKRKHEAVQIMISLQQVFQQLDRMPPEVRSAIGLDSFGDAFLHYLEQAANHIDDDSGSYVPVSSLLTLSFYSICNKLMDQRPKDRTDGWTLKYDFSCVMFSQMVESWYFREFVVASEKSKES